MSSNYPLSPPPSFFLSFSLSLSFSFYPIYFFLFFSYLNMYQIIFLSFKVICNLSLSQILNINSLLHLFKVYLSMGDR